MGIVSNGGKDRKKAMMWWEKEGESLGGGGVIDLPGPWSQISGTAMLIHHSLERHLFHSPVIRRRVRCRNT